MDSKSIQKSYPSRQTYACLHMHSNEDPSNIEHKMLGCPR